MKPKEKAEELIYQFAQRIPPSSYEAYENGVQINFDLENSKQCALVAVDEVLGDCEVERYKYWNEVKKEIEKL